MKQEGIVLPDGELGWFLKSKLGLDPLRSQLLETALAGRESYDAVEGEVLRLFKDLHTADPLYRKSNLTSDGKGSLLPRFLQQSGTTSSSSRTSYPSSSAPSVASSGQKSLRSFAPRPSSTYRKQFQSGPRQAHVAELDDETMMEEPEDVEPDEEGSPEGHHAFSLEEVLQAEAEGLAAELEQAEHEGIDVDVLNELETGVEQAAESLITMREARGKLAEVRNDRGYGRTSGSSSSPGKGKPHGNQATARKQSGKHPCWDCNEHGHWAGDPQCPKPGAGLGKKRQTSQGRHVKIAEAYNTELVVGPPRETAAANVVEHEVSMVQLDRGQSLDEAFQNSQSKCAEVNSANEPSLSWDKKLVGALDSACNRTCTGTTWLNSYLLNLKDAPPEIQALVCHEPEKETFRFGNGATKVSLERWRLPTMIGSTLVLFWTSVVPVSSLGLLLGRDFMDAIGAVLSFSRKALRCDHLNSGVIPLRQLQAGHFMLPLLPERWCRPGLQRWCRLGQDNVIELQVSGTEWVRRKLAAQGLIPCKQHEHLVTEWSEKAADVKFSGLQPLSHVFQPAPAVQVSMKQGKQPGSLTSPSSPTSCVRDAKTSFGRRQSVDSRSCADQMAQNGGTKVRKGRLACFWTALVACAAALPEVPAVSVPINKLSNCLGGTSGLNGEVRSLCKKALPQSQDQQSLHSGEYARVHAAAQPHGHRALLCGRPHADWNDGSPIQQGPQPETSSWSDCRSQSRSQTPQRREGQGGSSQVVDWTERWIANSSRRFVAPCNSAACGDRRSRHDRGAQDQDSSSGGKFEGSSGRSEVKRIFNRALRGWHSHCGRKGQISSEASANGIAKSSAARS